MLRQIIRSAGVVALGTGLGQGAILVATPLLARLYTPLDFGALAMITSVSNIAMAAACLRYDLALPSASAKHARPLLIIAALSALGVSLAVLAVNTTFAALHGEHLGAPFNTPSLVALCVLLAGLCQAALGWATRARAFGRFAGVRFAQGMIFSILAAGSVVGLVWAHILSFLAGILAVWKMPLAKTAEGMDPLEVAWHHRQFPIVSLPGALLDVVGYSVCIWIITSSYGSSDAGHYAQVQRLVGAPLMLIGMSLGQVLLRQSADVMHDAARLERLFRQVLKALGLLAIVVVLLTASVGEPLLHWMLGTQWRVDVMFITPIAVAVAVRACTSPLSTILLTVRRFDLALRWQATYFLSAVTVLWFATTRLDFGTFVIIYAAHECVFYGAYLLLIQSAIRTSTCAESLV